MRRGGEKFRTKRFLQVYCFSLDVALERGIQNRHMVPERQVIGADDRRDLLKAPRIDDQRSWERPLGLTVLWFGKGARRAIDLHDALAQYSLQMW